ncbi:MAG: FHA domain-containing protein [Deltaproteobacteria bacterium]|nr:FHA domain-containing protein [Deltaproteobacteria bacterium]
MGPPVRPQGTPVVVFECGDRRHTLVLGKAAAVVGRDPEATLPVDDEGLSRQHAKFVPAADGVVHVMDLGSTNGTYVNGERISLRILREGDEIKLGPDVRGKLRYRREGDRHILAVLTERQLEIAGLVARGLTSPQIGQRLDVSARTVASHLERIYARLDVRGRVELTQRVIEAGLAVPDDGS